MRTWYILLIIILLLLPIIFVKLAEAAPFIVSDDTTQTVTHCGYYLDSAPKIDVPVTDTKACKVDLSSVTVGVHTVKLTYVLIVPGWGRSESAPSSPFTFTRPSPTISVSPGSLAITQ